MRFLIHEVYKWLKKTEAMMSEMGWTFNWSENWGADCRHWGCTQWPVSWAICSLASCVPHSWCWTVLCLPWPLGTSQWPAHVTNSLTRGQLDNQMHPYLGNHSFTETEHMHSTGWSQNRMCKVVAAQLAGVGSYKLSVAKSLCELFLEWDPPLQQ
jgi:hypothetical protein